MNERNVLCSSSLVVLIATSALVPKETYACGGLVCKGDEGIVLGALVLATAVVGTDVFLLGSDLWSLTQDEVPSYRYAILEVGVGFPQAVGAAMLLEGTGPDPIVLTWLVATGFITIHGISTLVRTVSSRAKTKPPQNASSPMRSLIAPTVVRDGERQSLGLVWIGHF